MHQTNSPYPAGFGYKNNRAIAIEKDLSRTRQDGLQRVKSFSFTQLCLALILIAAGIATLVLASENIGFPVFNFGPLVTGILVFVAGCLGFYAARKGLRELSNDRSNTSINCMIRANFGISVAVISIATISAVFAFLSGAVCSGANIPFYTRSGNTRTRIDVEQYCYPNKSGNTALAFIDGALCILAVVWVILGLCMYCFYGRLFGIRRRGF